MEKTPEENLQVILKQVEKGRQSSDWAFDKIWPMVKPDSGWIPVTEVIEMIDALTFNTEDQAGVKFNCLVSDELKEKLQASPPEVK